MSPQTAGGSYLTGCCLQTMELRYRLVDRGEDWPPDPVTVSDLWLPWVLVAVLSRASQRVRSIGAGSGRAGG